MADQVTLGRWDVDVYAQRHAYLMNKMVKFFNELVKSNVDVNNADAVIGMLGGRAYDLLTLAIPQYGKRCPRYEFLGYASQQALDAGEYDEEHDFSPTFPQMVNAFEVASKVNRFDVVKVMTNVIDPKLLKTWFNSQLAAFLLTDSARSPVPPDGSEASMSFGTTAPTSTESMDSPLTGFDLSLTPENVGE